jgi:hypothetical protein
VYSKQQMSDYRKLIFSSSPPFPDFPPSPLNFFFSLQFSPHTDDFVQNINNLLRQFFSLAFISVRINY